MKSWTFSTTRTIDVQTVKQNSYHNFTSCASVNKPAVFFSFHIKESTAVLTKDLEARVYQLKHLHKLLMAVPDKGGVKSGTIISGKAR